MNRNFMIFFVSLLLLSLAAGNCIADEHTETNSVADNMPVSYGYVAINQPMTFEKASDWIYIVPGRAGDMLAISANMNAGTNCAVMDLYGFQHLAGANPLPQDQLPNHIFFNIAALNVTSYRASCVFPNYSYVDDGGNLVATNESLLVLIFEPVDIGVPMSGDISAVRLSAYPPKWTLAQEGVREGIVGQDLMILNDGIGQGYTLSQWINYKNNISGEGNS